MMWNRPEPGKKPAYARILPVRNASSNTTNGNKNSFLQRNKLLLLRLMVIFCLVSTAVIVGYGSYYLLSRLQKSLQTKQYNSTVNKIEESVKFGISNKKDALITITESALFVCNNATAWPQCAIPLSYFDRLSSPLTRMAQMRTISIAAIVTPAQVQSFEDYMYDFLADNGYPTLGISPFGKGIFAVNPTTKQRYHDVNGTSPAGKYQILTPVVEIGDLPNNKAAIMFNLYSETKRSLAIDSVIDCCLAGGSDCTAITDIVSLVQDATFRPANLVIQPIRVNSQGMPVALTSLVHNWDTILSQSVANSVSGIHVVLDNGQDSYTFLYEKGVAKFVLDGDGHDSKYNSQRHSFVATTFQGAKTFTVTLYPTDEWVEVYETQVPLAVCAVTVGIIVFTSLIFFFYDYLMNRQALEKELVLNTKRQFVRYVSHEIRTPLNIVHLGLKVLYTEVFKLKAKYQQLQDRLASSTKVQQQAANTSNNNIGSTQHTALSTMTEVSDNLLDWLELVNDIEESSDAAISVLNDLINYDKLDTGNLNIEVEPVAIWDLFGPSVRPFLVQARHANVELTIDLEYRREDVSFFDKKQLRRQLVLGDRIKLGQVLRNLVSNALKFTPSGGYVHVEAKWNRDGMPEYGVEDEEMYKRCGSLVVTVKDSGAGISTENLQRLFSEGMQFNANQLQAGQGSGLGLWIAKGVVNLHGGRLVASSDGENQGTTFLLELPLVLILSNSTDSSVTDVEAFVEEAAYHASKVNESMMKGMSKNSKIRNILVVDDSTLNRKIMCRLLRSAGYVCFEATDGQDCVDSVERSKEGFQDPIHLILMDFEMPRMTGPVATAVLRNLGYTMPVLGITGNVLSNDKEYFLNNGANKVLQKPITLSALEATIDEYNYSMDDHSHAVSMDKSLATLPQ